MEVMEVCVLWLCGFGCVGLCKYNILINDKYINIRLVENGRIYL